VENLTQTRISLLEKNKKFADLVAEILLSKTIALVHFTNLSDAKLELYSSEQPQLILLGTGFAQDEILDFIQQVCAAKAVKPIPIILIFDEMDVFLIQAALKAGIARYLTISFLRTNLIPTIYAILHENSN
jgi:DNA-binding response OmpR family regulator